mmetsp:Transcript_41503/g.64924  ORF Transcript_41503/g.64924 Transcript_41503/m.64924 type:complete len:258 (+) Transcript_41503:51-824(+)
MATPYLSRRGAQLANLSRRGNNTHLSVLVRQIQSGTFQTASEWLNYIEDKTSGTNLVKKSALDYLLRACNTEDDLRNCAAKAFKVYGDKRIEMNQTAAGLFLNACFRINDPSAAVEVLEDESKRVQVWIGKSAFNKLLTRLDAKYPPAAAAAEGEGGGARRAVAEMERALAAVRRAGFRPTPRTYHLLVNSCLKRDDLERAQKFADQAGSLLRASTAEALATRVSQQQQQQAKSMEGEAASGQNEEGEDAGGGEGSK